MSSGDNPTASPGPGPGPAPAADSNNPLRIAIVGGAIGGLSAALLIDHFCRTRTHTRAVAIDVYEQAPAYQEIGAGVGLGLNATKLLHLVPGLGPRLNAIQGDHVDSWVTHVRYDNGQRITNAHGPVRGPPKQVRPLTVARSEFLDVLLGAIRERGVARLHTGKRLTAVEDLGAHNGVRMRFLDGTTADADVLVGSDGIHSEVRKQFMPDKRPLYSGKIAYRGVVPIAQLPPGTTSPGPTWSVLWMARHKHFLVFPISQLRSLNIVAFVSKREADIPDLQESWTNTCDRSELEADFAEFEPTVQNIIRLMPPRVSKWRINDHEPVPQWSFLDGRVALLGDACHATTPHQGAGAGQAIEDAYILARALADWLDASSSSSLREWMELYQRIRLPRAQRIVVTSREMGELYELEKPEIVDLPYDEAVSRIADDLNARMKWIWKEDLAEIYEQARQEAGLSPPGVKPPTVKSQSRL